MTTETSTEPAAAPGARLPSNGTATTESNYRAAPITHTWDYTLAVTRTEPWGATPLVRFEREWRFTVGPLGTVDITTQSESGRQSDPDPGSFARALASEITRAHARRSNL